MEVVASKRVQSIGGYAFDEVDKLVAQLKSEGIDPIDFGVGDPTAPTPELIRRATQVAVDAHACSGYPSYIGSLAYREAVSRWMLSRFGVAVDANKEIASTIGSKEAVFNFAEGVVDPGDLVLIPTPGYPPYKRGTLFAEGESYFYPILKENDYLPDLGAIPAAVADRARLLWINYPNSPTGRIPDGAFFERVIAWAQRHNVLLASDEAYTEIYFDRKPHSILEFGRDGILAFFSLSKRSAMTGYRIGWVAGDERLVSIFKKVKTNIDSGTPDFVQAGAIAALAEEDHVEVMREEYRQKRDIIVSAFKDIGCEDCSPEGTLYIWQRVPDGHDAVSFAKSLLHPEVAIVVTPGAWLSDVASDGSNPGSHYVRLALVPTIAQTRLAAERIRALG